MQTEIKKSYRWGFTVTEQDLRRTVQVAIESFNKLPNATSPTFSAKVKLKDGSVINTSLFDDVFALENSGEKLIQSISLSWNQDSDESTPKVGILFVNGNSNEKSWDSISYKVSGNTRDWAFVTASEIDERVKRTKQIAWESILASKFIFPLLMMFATVAATYVATYFTAPDESYITLRKLYEHGQLKDSIDAMIRLEELKSKKDTFKAVIPLFATYATIGTLFFVFGWLTPRISPSYNFCWGDYVQRYESAKKMRTAFWTLIVLATIVSIAANFLSKKLGI